MPIALRKQGSSSLPHQVRGACLLSVVLLALCGPLTEAHAGHESTPTPDASQILRKMIATYQNAKSVQEDSEVKILQGDGQQYIQTNAIRFRRPAFLSVTSEDRNQGTLGTYNNGITVTLYFGKSNIYTKFSAPKTFPELMEKVNKVVPQVLSPLSIMMAKNGNLREAGGFTYKGTETVEGHKTYLLQGQASLDWMRQIITAPRYIPRARTVLLYIDCKTNVLIRSKVLLLWTAVFPAQGKEKARAVPQGFGFEETHRGIAFNGNLPDSTFFFSPPKGAEEFFQERK